MVAVDQNFRARRERRRKTTAHFIHRSAASAALCEGCGWDGNSNRRGRRFSQRNDCGGTQPIGDYLYQGMTLDFVTGLYYARNRNYSPSLGVWISQDPLQYVNGANTYQMEMSGPVGGVDWSGQFYWWGLAHIVVGAAVAAFAATAAATAGPELAAGAAIYYGVLFTAGMFEASAGATVSAVSAIQPNGNYSQIPMTYPQATIGLGLQAAGVSAETSNAAANLVPIGPPEEAIAGASPVVRAVLTANGYKEMISKPLDAYTVGYAAGSSIAHPAGTTGAGGTGNAVRLHVRMSVSGPARFAPHEVKNGETLWSIWRGVAQPKPSWQETLTVHSSILANVNALVPGQYVLAPVSSCGRPGY